MVNPIARVVDPVDRWQQRHRPVAFVVAVVKKFGDDRGGVLAALITFYGFLSLLPLILLATTVLEFVLHGDPGLQRSILNSALGEFPLIGQDLHSHTLHGSPFAVAVGIVGLTWGSLGVAQALQFAAGEIWAGPAGQRLPFLARLVRAFLFYGAVGVAVLATSSLTVLGAIVGNSLAVGALGLAAALLINVALFLVVFKVLSPADLGWADLLPGAVVGGVGWQALQVVGQSLVRHNLRHASELYGQFAIVLGLLSFLSFAAQLFVYTLEINAVRHGRLWPRSLVADADRPPPKGGGRKTATAA